MTNPSAVNKILIGLLVLLVASVIVLSFVPPVTKDELVHHLAVPKLYLKHGGIYEIPFMDFSYYPMNLQLLYMIPLGFGQDILPKFIHFAFALLSAWLVYGYLKSRLGPSYGLLGALLFLSTPIIIKLSITAYVDLGLIFFSTASLLLLLRWASEGFKLRFLVLSGIMCGLGLGTKYNGLVLCLLLTLLVPVIYTRYSKGELPGFSKSALQGVIFLAVSLLVFSPWAVRNYLWTQNPIHPLYGSWLNSERLRTENPAVEQEEEPRAPIGLFAYRRAVYGEEGWEIALLPLRVFLQGQDGDPRYFDGRLNPFLLFLPFLAFIGRKEDPANLSREKKLFLAYAALFLVIAVFSSHMRTRYISPILPPVMILSVLGFEKLLKLSQGSRGGKAKTAGVVLAVLVGTTMLGYNAQYLASQFRYVEPFSYIAGKVSREEYIAKHRPEYPAMKYINQALSANARIAFLFLGNRGYYCERDYVYGEDLFRKILKQANNPDQIYSALAASKITHLFIYTPLFQEWVFANFPEEKLDIINGFLIKYSKFIYNISDYSIISLVKPLS